MRVVKNASGRLETTGSWDDALATEAAQRARIAATRSEIRAMLEGNLQFHIDPLAAPVVAAPQPVQPEVEAPQPVQPGPDGVIGYFRWLGPRSRYKTPGKTYAVVMRNGMIGSTRDDGSIAGTFPMKTWQPLFARLIVGGQIELCDKDGVKLCA